METVETEVLLEFVIMLESSIDVQFQAWMAVSFAVIVACYSVERDLGPKIRSAIAILYLLAVYALFARWATEAIRLTEIQDVLASRGIEFYPYWFAPPARALTYVLGSLTTIGAIFYFRKEQAGYVGTDT